MDWLLYFSTLYAVINLGVATFFMILCLEADMILFPYLIYNLREKYRLNWVGTIIILSLLVVLFSPAIILDYIILGLLFIFRNIASKFCKIFERKDL